MAATGEIQVTTREAKEPAMPRTLHPAVRLTGLTRAHTIALATTALDAGEFVVSGDGQWAITTPELSYIGGTATTASWVFGEAHVSPLAWLERHIARHPAHTRVGRLLRTVRQRVLDAQAALAELDGAV